MYAYVCGRDEPFSYLIPFYSSSCIVLLVIARTAQCFRFRYTVTFELSVYLASLRCVSTTRQEKHGVVRGWRNRAKLTSKESQERNESMAFFFPFLIYPLAFLSTRFAPVSISPLSLSGRTRKDHRNEVGGDARRAKRFVRGGRKGGRGGGNIEADHRTVTRPESNSIRSPGIQFATRLLPRTKSIVLHHASLFLSVSLRVSSMLAIPEKPIIPLIIPSFFFFF